MDRIRRPISPGARLIGGAGARCWGMFAGFRSAPDRSSCPGPRPSELLRNLRFFRRFSEPLHAGGKGYPSLMAGRIAAILHGPPGPEDADVIDCGGRAVTPDCIDCHFGMRPLSAVSQLAALTQEHRLRSPRRRAGSGSDAAARFHHRARHRGARVFGLKMAVDSPASDRGVRGSSRRGAMISQTSAGQPGDFGLSQHLAAHAGRCGRTTPRSTGVSRPSPTAEAEVLAPPQR